MIRGQRLVSAMLVVVGLVAVACAPSAGTGTAGTQGAVATQAPVAVKLRVGMATIDTGMDPHANLGVGASPRRGGMYEGLVDVDEAGKIRPALAMEWKNLSPTSWQFKLAPGRKFHNGNPVTAEDIKYSFDRASNPELKLASLPRIATVDRTEIVDPQTINIITKGPDPILLKRVGIIMIVEKAYVERVGKADFALKGMGTGPYMQQEYVEGDRLVLVANPSYPTQPASAEVTMRQIPEASSRLAGLRAGELDLINGLSGDQAEMLQGAGFTVINFDQGTANCTVIFTTLPAEPTSNKLVRQALNYAIDKDAISKSVYKGYGKPTGQVVQATTVGYNPSIKPYPYDPKKAKELLASAGYANGFKMKIDVPAMVPAAQQLYLLIQSQFRDVGIDADVNVSADSATILDHWYGRSQRATLQASTLQNSPAMDADFALSWFNGKIAEPERRYNNPAFDTAYLTSTTELNEARRSQLLQEAIAVMYEDAPVLFLVDGFVLWAASPTLTGAKVYAPNDVAPRFELIGKK